MTTKLTWIASVSTSCLHAADACVRGKTIADPRLAASVPEPAFALRDAIQNSPLPAERFWHTLLTLAHQFENNRELATVAIRKTSRWEPEYDSLAASLGDRIGTLEGAVLRAIPGIVDELDLRSRPLRDLWEAQGPGLLNRIGELTDRRLIVDNAEVILVLPALGGGGAAHLLNNTVRIEAVLTNNVPLLPEIVRLGWLLAQLNCDLPVFSELLPAGRLAFLAPLAFIPPVLQAAQEVGLVEFHEQSIATALNAWHLQFAAANLSENLFIWWQTYLESTPEWNTALSALDQMSGGTGPCTINLDSEL